MAYVDRTAELRALYGTGTHGDEGYATPGGQYPGQMRWSDLHPPGVRVLPRGSPPAGPGEINWEDTLGGRFALALAKLEGLLYAVFGSRPHAESDGMGGWIRRQWYDRQHPRCLWGPEAWERRLFRGAGGCTDEGECWDYDPVGKEYAALGEHPPCCPMPRPHVPIRSRSGDPELQYRIGTHDRAVFALGSLTRTHSSAPYDPPGGGWFGATLPGRTDGVGYEHLTGEPVTITYTLPDGVDAPTSLTLWYQLRPPGGAWSAWTSIPMTGGPPAYSATIAAQLHRTEARWYIRYYYDDPSGDDVTAYDPGGDSAPADTDAYYLQWFAHYNPYARGLPEMLDDYGGVDIRHGTDYYQFDGSETIQPELLNLVRWTLSWLGGNCCGGEYEGCAETDARSDVAHHNPRYRGGDDGLCCVPMPIKFRWSGSNQHPHYMRGGKGLVGGPDSPPDIRPLTNHPEHVPGPGETWGSETARKTWRGITMLYADSAHFGNPYYGGGYSWGTAPGTYILAYHPTYHDEARVYAKFPSWGLRAGDVIDAVHIEEIIAAIDYLIDYGVWTTVPICTRKRTPAQYMGKDCGYHYWVTYHDCLGTEGFEFRKGCERCCSNAAGCESVNTTLGYWVHYWGPGYDYEEELVPDTCIPWSAPTHAECVADCLSDKCTMISRKHGYSQYSPIGNPTCPCGRGYWEDTSCDGPSDILYEASPGCGYHRDETACTAYDPISGECVTNPHKGYKCVRSVAGWSYYACTPAPCYFGWDSTHGNPYRKHRIGHTWQPEFRPVATGPGGGEHGGNCLGDITICGTIYPIGEHAGVWFSEVTGIYWPGMVAGWYSGCDGMPACDPSCDWPSPMERPPPVPGYGYHDRFGASICSVYDRAIGGCGSAWAGIACCTGHICDCSVYSYPPCLGEAAWVAVDLNLDGSGYPYRRFRGRDGTGSDYAGVGIPRLRDYDLTRNPATWMHDCPCETWTGAGTCV